MIHQDLIQTVTDTEELKEYYNEIEELYDLGGEG